MIFEEGSGRGALPGAEYDNDVLNAHNRQDSISAKKKVALFLNLDQAVLIFG
jgi:hypothetical protein